MLLLNYLIAMFLDSRYCNMVNTKSKLIDEFSVYHDTYNEYIFLYKKGCSFIIKLDIF